MNQTRIYYVLVWVVLSSLACEDDIATGYQYGIPVSANDGWSVGSADDAGISSSVLSDMMDFIYDTPGHNIHSILIFKDQKLVFEEYFEGYLYSGNPPGSNGDYISYDRETDHYLASISKSITSVICGAALKEGFIENLDDKVIDLLPGYEDTLAGAKADITLEHLLTMSSGLAWDESSYSYEDSRNDVVQIFTSSDPIGYILSRPLLSEPGTEFLYNSGGTNVIGAIIQEHSGMSLLEFGNQYLFDPLNISGGVWQRLSDEYFFASGGLFLRPRELAKIGFLFLNKGRWEDRQIITEGWIEASVNEHINTLGRTLPAAHAYGYQWWIEDFQFAGKTYHSFLAAGWGDQYMFVFPETGMMALFNGGNYLSSGSINLFTLVGDYILGALP